LSPSTLEAEVRASLRARRTAPAKPPWEPPALSVLACGIRILAFDASLANVGWVLFSACHGITVERHGTIHPRQQADGYLGTWQRAKDLRFELWSQELTQHMHNPEILKAVEAPVVGAGHRKESSLMAGAQVWMECDACAVISATHVSAVLLGDPKILSRDRKPAVKAAVLRYVPEAQGRGWDEHQRDALSVGLTRLFDMQQEAAA
jgi:hypothetical protein